MFFTKKIYSLEILTHMFIFQTQKEHEEKIKTILKYFSNNQKLTLSNKNSNTLRNGDYKKNSLLLDFSLLNAPLCLNSKEECLSVEPQITFENLCKVTLRYGWIPPVVPEFKNITVAGAIMGASLESSSHLYGQFNDICLEYECILGNGRLLRASPHENSDLFYGVSGSYGTLALITAVTIRLKRAKKYVNLSYRSFSNLQEGLDLIKQTASVDFKEAVLFNRTHMRVSSGVMSDQPSGFLFQQKHWRAEWYASHLLKTEAKEEYMTLYEYLFRYDRGAFWMGRYISDFKTLVQIFFKIGIPKLSKSDFPHTLSRLFFGWMFSSKYLYKLWHLVPEMISKNLFFVHDFYVPNESFEKALEVFLKKTEIFPVWLCPILGTKTAQFLSPHFGSDRFINIGLYGIPKTNKSLPELTIELEKEILNFNGRKMLYSFTYYDFETFSKTYDLNRYDKLRKKYDAEKTFVHIYDKVNNSVL